MVMGCRARAYVREGDRAGSCNFWWIPVEWENVVLERGERCLNQRLSG